MYRPVFLNQCAASALQVCRQIIFGPHFHLHLCEKLEVLPLFRYFLKSFRYLCAVKFLFDG